MSSSAFTGKHSRLALARLPAIARQHSFSKAAEELFISQPAISRHVAELEKALGVQLVTRDAQGAALTSAGEYLAEYVLRAEALLAQASEGLQRYAHTTAATLHVAASGTPGNYLLPPHPVRISTGLSRRDG